MPGSSIQAAVDQAGANAAFCLKNGVHRMQVVRPLDGQSFYGEGGTILNGSRLLTEFTREGSYLGRERPDATRAEARRVPEDRAGLRPAGGRVHRRQASRPKC